MSLNISDTLIHLFEDEHILAVHKPAGVPFHSDDQQQGIVSLVRDEAQSNQLFPVHRLDKMTSGLMLFAKTRPANQTLSELLAKKHVEKYYLALSAKKPKRKQGMVTGDMLKGRRGSYILSREKSNPAITRFFARSSQVLRENSLGHESSWVFVLKPETGKTHQLRVALKSLASPILGDERYGGASSDRGYLHAYKMRFNLFGQRYDITDPNFYGEAFDLSQVVDSQEISQPQSMSWPKAAYLLDKD